MDATGPELLPSDEATQKNSTKKESFLVKRKNWIKKKFKRRSAEANKQNHFTYEHMLLRYGDWRNVRGQILAYMILLLAACFHKAHRDLLVVIANLHSISSGGRHVHCCCTQNNDLMYAEKQGAKIGIDKPWAVLILIFGSLFSLTCPLWEKYLGRRNALGAACLLGIILSICSCFGASPDVHLFWSIGLTIANVVITTITMSTLSEMLPYNIRYIAVILYLFVAGACNAVAMLHFRFDLIGRVKYLGIISVVMYAIGVVVVIFFARDSIIHLVIRNKSDLVEKTILRKEMRFFEKEPQGSEEYHRAIAKSIFHDLVYLERDEIKLGRFFKKLYSNWAMAEIILGFFQSISAGAIEYEFSHFWTEHFADPYFVNAIDITGYALTGLIMLLLRKTHRIKALQWLFAACLLSTCFHHVTVQMDKGNHCSSDHHHFFKYEFLWFSWVVNAFTVGLGSSLQLTIMLHFLETTPSILRPMCVMLIYFPMKGTRELCKTIFGEHGVEDTQTIIPVYLYHLLIIAITMFRSRMKTRLQYSLHLFDLMPQETDPVSDKEEEEGEKAALLDPSSTGGLTVPDTTGTMPAEKSTA